MADSAGAVVLMMIMMVVGVLGIADVVIAVGAVDQDQDQLADLSSAFFYSLKESTYVRHT